MYRFVHYSVTVLSSDSSTALYWPMNFSLCIGDIVRVRPRCVNFGVKFFSAE